MVRARSCSAFLAIAFVLGGASAASAEEPTSTAPAEEPTATASAEQPTPVVSAEQPTPAVSAEEPTSTAPAEEPVPTASDEEPTPAVSRLHTLSIHVRSHAIHDSLHGLLAETLGLPRIYEAVTYGRTKYVAVWAGNIALEPCGPYPPDNYLSTDFEAMFYGLTFAAWESAADSAVVLAERGIGHAEPTDTLRIEDDDLRAPNVYVGIGWGGESEGLARARSEFEARKGGALGVVRVEEIRVGTSDERNLRKWIAFLRPHDRIGERAFEVADGPILRFVEHGVKEVLGITLRVRSLEAASAFLREQGLLGKTTAGSVEIDPGRIHGLRVALEE